MTDSPSPILSASGVTYGFARRPDFLQPVDLDIGARQCWGIIGPNGAGKSTLLRLLAGLLTPASGTMRLEGAPFREVPTRQRARRIAFLPQNMPGDLPSTAREIVLMGRFPHRRFGLFESAEDMRIADRALAAMGATAFADRPMSTLSGGEAQRVHIAAIIAQEPAVLLLDEPTASLDLYHQLSIFTLLGDLTARSGVAVVVVTHDVNLAARFCSRVLLLDDGRPVAKGAPAEVLRPEVLQTAYDVELTTIASGLTPCPWIVPLRARPHGGGQSGDRRGEP
ncbi:MAG TPA: ABC transporter ATP-binding protein [Phycisphaerae bacterium]|nr:ABC transporter ATP-binding protein [Phycisphaerae bacterium]